MPYRDHQKQAQESVPCAVVTVSDTRTVKTDKSGPLIRELLEQHGHTAALLGIVKDEPSRIRALIDEIADEGECWAVFLNGGTGLAPRDTTIEAVDALLERRITGFGELFRFLSYEQIGSGAMLSRATAGVYRSLMLFSMPGSPAAVRLAMEKLIVPELSHMVWLLRSSK